MDKKPKGSGLIWSKRFFSLTKTRLVYYQDKSRSNYKGEIILPGAVARPSATRRSRRQRYYITITHPICGTRELMTTSRTRQNQWIDRINDVVQELRGKEHILYGPLQKQGGLRKNAWQERWCIIVGNTLDYYDQATDNQAKGSIRKSCNILIEIVDLLIYLLLCRPV